MLLISPLDKWLGWIGFLVVAAALVACYEYSMKIWAFWMRKVGQSQGREYLTIFLGLVLFLLICTSEQAELFREYVRSHTNEVIAFFVFLAIQELRMHYTFESKVPGIPANRADEVWSEKLSSTHLIMSFIWILEAGYIYGWRENSLDFLFITPVIAIPVLKHVRRNIASVLSH